MDPAFRAVARLALSATSAATGARSCPVCRSCEAHRLGPCRVWFLVEQERYGKIWNDLGLSWINLESLPNKIRTCKRKFLRTKIEICLYTKDTWAVAKTWILFLYTNIRLPRSLPHYFRSHSFHFRGRFRATIHFRSASANISILEIKTAVKNVLQVPRRFREHWFSDPFCERLREASALRVFTSARSSELKPKIKRKHRDFGRCSPNDIGWVYQGWSKGELTENGCRFSGDQPKWLVRSEYGFKIIIYPFHRGEHTMNVSYNLDVFSRRGM